jgi:aspartyl-tRNA(Asn)/glutamyl-tRNA(Gln) amidotransferase subunit C
VKITAEEVKKIADLANLSVSVDELPKLASDVDHILEYIDQLESLDTTDVQPMAQVLYVAEETATLRPDVVRPPLSNEKALQNAALKGNGLFKVPKVIER